MIVVNNIIQEGSSAWAEITTSDINDLLVIPKTMNYWWTDSDGIAINNRNNIEIDSNSLSTVTFIELTPEDTTLPSNQRYDQQRILTVKYTYDSIRGNDKTKTFKCNILIEAFLAL